MYEDHVLDHYQNPYHKGGSKKNSYEGTAVSSVCGDKVTIRAVINNGVISQVWWDGDGCCFSQSAASMFVKSIENTPVESLRDFSEKDMLDLFRAECPKPRISCVCVCLKAFRNLLENWRP